MSDEKKKYPWIKSIFGKKKAQPLECVYAGPDQMTAKKGHNTTSEAEAVYAGPEYFEGNDGGDAPCEDVYAGPEFFDGSGDNNGPEEVKESTEVSEISECPGAREDPEKDVTGSDGSEEEKKEVTGIKFDKKSEAMMQGVYAGPSVPPVFVPSGFTPSDSVPKEMFMTVYAGPDFWNGPNAGKIGAYAPEPGETYSKENVASDDDSALRCPSCGNAVDPDAKFCKECGTPVKKPEPVQGRCPACGAELIPGTKFCHECGTPVKSGE